MESVADPANLVSGFAESEDLLQDVAVIGGMVACVGWSCAVKKGRTVIVRTGRVGKQVRRFVECQNLHAVWWCEFVGVGVLRQLDRRLHKCGPDGCGCVGAFHFDI